MITDSEYNAWLAKTKTTDVVLVDITTSAGQTLRVSTQQYRTPDALYRARLLNFEIVQEIESGIAGYSVFGVGELLLVNSDHKLDSWLELVMQSVTVRYGDVTWPIEDFRTLRVGQFYDVTIAANNLRITLRDQQASLDRLIEPSQITTLTGLPGALVTSIMVESGEFVAGDIDTASFAELDTLYPYPCTIAINTDGENLAGALDRVLAGFPCDYGIDTDGKVRCHIFKVAESTTQHRTLSPTQSPRIERVAPHWQVSFTSATTLWDAIEENRPPIKSVNPDANVFTAAISVTNQSDAVLLANDFLDLFNIPYERFIISTNASVSGIEILDTLNIQYPNFGYKDGRLGVVTKITNRIRQFSELEVWFG